ncbi:MAG: aminotransferase class V-fold PLP-dependent enzyme [Planctomycetia bacterium]|nr:aminotransferase class V-fold PLP-dependent enzyme [Planctomycetia bacterium]
MTREIYLDFNGSTPIAPEVLAAMRPSLKGNFGNPSSSHWAAQGARDAVERARGQVAALIGSDPTEVVFTSGGTEANNHALKGVFWSRKDAVAKPHFVTSAVEHPAILVPLRFLERLGAEVTVVGVDRYGRVDPDDIRHAIRADTVLVSVMHANNEVGTIQLIAEIGAMAREHGILFHTDAAQTVGKIAVDVDALQVDLLSIAGHKLYAPKGVGALYIREGTALESLLHGGEQEAGRRAGTESAQLATALGEACAASRDWVDSAVIRQLRDQFWQLLQQRFQDGVVLNGHPVLRLPNTLNVSFLGCDGAALLGRLEGVAASTGSACHAGHIATSPVLAAMGASEAVSAGAIRFSLGRTTTLDEIAQVVEQLGELVPRVRVKSSAGGAAADCDVAARPSKPLANMTGEEIMAAVSERYGQVAQSPRAKFNFPVGRAFAESVGYDAPLLARLPDGLSESFAGAGNPQPFVDARLGETVLDLGCGAGLDVYHYARAVGSKGKVYGLDSSEAMLRKAKENLRTAGIDVILLRARANQIPLPAASVDLVTANGIFNLSPDKDAVIREVARVLKPSGRTIFAEILAKEDLPGDMRRDLNDWFRCIGGALTKEAMFERLRRAGLADPQVLWLGRNARTGHPLSICAVIRAERRKE